MKYPEDFINKVICGDCITVMKDIPDNSIDTIITDPPYGLKFMGKKWDYDVPSVDIWKECLRVLKPGGYLLSFAGTRTQHRMAVNIEDAGFEIRDMIAWVYGSGFPKSLNISKQLDKKAGKKGEKYIREDFIKRSNKLPQRKSQVICGQKGIYNKPATPEAKQWEGYGTALKPALEPITVARKPLGEKTVAENVLKYGTGGINIDGCRVGVDDNEKEHFEKEWDREQSMSAELGGVAMNKGLKAVSLRDNVPSGRFPANLIHDGSDEVVGLFPQTGKGNGGSAYNYKGKEYDNKETSMFNGDKPQAPSNFNDSGSASRFFYCAKASKRERNIGCEGLGGNKHCTVKPLALMEYLVKLVSREGQVVLDPFMGSGTTGMACVNTGRDFIGIEQDKDYCKIAEARINAIKVENKLPFN